MKPESRASGIEAFTRDWTRVVTGQAVLRHSRDEVYTLLERLARRLAGALAAEPFTAAAGQRIGADLVAAGIATPELLGRTVTLTGHRFLADLGLDDPGARDRLDELLGVLVTGFSGALVERTVAAQEALRRAELADRRRIKEYLALPGRKALLQRLAAARDGRLGLCLINLDRFATVNDSLGYRAGDQALSTVAHRLDRLATTSGFFLAHLHADTFVLLLTGTTGPDEVTKAADAALAAIARTFPINNGYNLPIRASVGVVEQPVAGTDPAALLGAAERALAWAKAERRGSFVVYDPQRAAAETARHRLSAEMPDALTRGEFVVHYQPLVELTTGRLAGVEALVRWEHPVHGRLGPARFIELAEHTGLIVPLGEQVLRRACAQAAAWQPLAPVFVSVNIAAAQLRRPGLPAVISAILDQTGLPARRLQLEVTENVLLDPEMRGTLDELARRGVSIALDDFGTGTCRLSEISNLPVHTLKIAACFIEFLRDRPAATGPDHTVLTAMIDLGRALNLAVTVEGIETPAQAGRLLELGCDTGQGFHLGRPVSADVITARLASRP
jgi:diguanylate cyclase (GGDEF)-like protein